LTKIYNSYCTVERFFNTFAMILIAAMMVIVVADVAGIFLANKPFPAALELTEFFMVAIVYSALAYTQSIKGHITIELFTERFGAKRRLIVETASFFIGLIFFVFLAWQTWNMFWYSLQIREIAFTAAFPLPRYPAKCLLFIGCVLMCIRFVAQIAGNIEALLKGN